MRKKRATFLTVFKSLLIPALFLSSIPIGYAGMPVKTVRVAVIDTRLVDYSKGLRVAANKIDPAIKFSMPIFLDHGKHVTEVLTEKPDPKLGVSYNPEVYFYGGIGSDDSLEEEIKGLKEAINDKVRVINLSFNGPDFDRREYRLLKKASDMGIIIVAAAGNESVRLSKTSPSTYPCQSEIKNLICVGGSSNGSLASYSNYGSSVHIYTEGAYDQEREGTSYSAPRIARALATAINSYNTPVEKLLEDLLATADVINLDSNELRIFNEKAFFRKVAGLPEK